MAKSIRLSGVVMVLLGLLAVGSTSKAQQYIFTTLDYPGAIRTGACDAPNGAPGTVCATYINNAGQIVGNYVDQNNVIYGFMWDNGNFTTLSNYPSVTSGQNCSTCYLGVDQSGEKIGYYALNLGAHAFLFTKGNFITIDPPGTSQAIADGMNDLSQVIITGYFGNSASWFLYNAGNFAPLPDGAHGINNIGQIVGFFDGTGFFYNYPNGAVTQISHPAAGPLGTFAYTSNDLGQIVGVYADNNSLFHGFLYNNGNWSTIDHPLGVKGTFVGGINNAGQISGVYYDGNGISHAFLGNPQLLQVSPSTNIVATGTPPGPFALTSFSYSVSSTYGSVSYQITGIPTWLNANITSGTATTSPITLTFTLINPGSVQPGTYTSTISFTIPNTTTVLATRTATLTVNDINVSFNGLIALINSFNLAQGIDNSLDVKVLAAQSAADSARANSAATACNNLGALNNEASAQSGNMLTMSQASQIIAASSQIRSALGCSS